MEKAKIMLTSIAVLALVSGAIALKTNKVKFGVATIFSCNTIFRKCDNPLVGDVRFTVAGTPGAITYSSVATNPNIDCISTCPNTFIVTLEP